MGGKLKQTNYPTKAFGERSVVWLSSLEHIVQSAAGGSVNYKTKLFVFMFATRNVRICLSRVVETLMLRRLKYARLYIYSIFDMYHYFNVGFMEPHYRFYTVINTYHFAYRVEPQNDQSFKNFINICQKGITPVITKNMNFNIRHT